MFNPEVSMGALLVAVSIAATAIGRFFVNTARVEKLEKDHGALVERIDNRLGNLESMVHENAAMLQRVIGRNEGRRDGL